MARLRKKNLSSKDRGSDSSPYPMVSSKDFAGSNRSYPIPSKEDAVDALRLAGLHGRSDVKSKIYKKYPKLRSKKESGGTFKKNKELLVIMGQQNTDCLICK